MALDLTLAILHHILAFGLISLLAVEGVLVRGLSPALIDRVARINRAYGMTAGLLLVVGVLRVIFGARGYEYYMGNPWFWAKMASFAAVGLLSVPPTLRILKWQRARQADLAFLPGENEIRSVLGYVRAESVFAVLILVFAATMARLG